MAITHFLDPETTPERALIRKIEEVLLHSPLGGGLWSRTRAEIEGMLAGLELIEPGLIPCVNWRPDGPRTRPLDPVQHYLLGAVGHKP